MYLGNYLRNLLLFFLIQLGVNYLLQLVLGSLLTNIYGLLAYCLLSSFIIAFFAAFLSTPREFKKTFIRQPAFHKMMLIYFAFFLVVDLILNIRYIIALV